MRAEYRIGVTEDAPFHRVSLCGTTFRRKRPGEAFDVVELTAGKVAEVRAAAASRHLLYCPKKLTWSVQDGAVHEDLDGTVEPLARFLFFGLAVAGEPARMG